MLEHRRALLAVQLGGVGARQAGVEGVFDGQLQLRAGAGLLAPVQHQQPLQALSISASNFSAKSARVRLARTFAASRVRTVGSSSGGRQSVLEPI
jgi:hypothetical protein